MWKFLSIVIISLVLIGCSNKTKEDNFNNNNIVVHKDISVDTVKEYMKTGNYTLIDVREEHEFKEGNIDKSINIPLSRIEDIKNTIMDLEKQIIIYCRSGRRSVTAAKKLIEYGYKNVYNMTGGFLDYN